MNQPQCETGGCDQVWHPRPDRLLVPLRANDDTPYRADDAPQDSKPQRVVARVLEGSVCGPMEAQKLFPADDPPFVLW